VPAGATRRDFLRAVLSGGACAASPTLLAGCRRTDGASLDWSIGSAELCTITDTMAALTWVTDEPRPTAIRYGTTGDLGAYLETGDAPALFHYIELTGLSPGTRYHYELSTRTHPSEEDPSPGVFTTLTPPPGAYRFSFATLNDVHVGAVDVGLIGGGGTPMSWPDPENPHWAFAVLSAIDEINRAGVDFAIVKGDLTTYFTLAEFEEARALLDAFEVPYYPLRGNHDRVGDNPEDYYLALFGDLLPGGTSHFAFRHRGVQFICLDSSNLDDGHPQLSADQVAWLAAQMQQHADRPAMIFLHHPVTDEATLAFSLYPGDQRAFFDAVEGRDNLAGVFCGHSHRDYISHQVQLGTAPCVETAATLHYPSGYNLVRVHDGGYLHTSHRMPCQNCLEWTEMTRGLYGGHAEEWLFLEAGLRNFVHRF